jgi:hypothetical protein
VHMRGTLMSRRRLVGATLVAALTSALVPTPTSASPAATTDSAAGVWYPMRRHCVGVEVRRCVWMEYNGTTGRLRAAARIKDARGGSDYTVAAHDLRLQWLTVDGRWALYRRTWGYDYDGWWPRSDTAVGRGRYFCGTRTYRAVAHFHWLGASPGAELVASGTRGIGRNC